MVVLVTGGNGFLGRYISLRLHEEGWQVVSAGRPELEIPSPGFTEAVLDSAPSLVVHCAGPASVAASLEDPVGDLKGSVEVLARLLEALRGVSPTPSVLLLSSAAVYGQPRRLPIGEDAELAPISPYGFHRVACELLLREFHQVYDVPAASMRIFSSYGEGLRRQILWDMCRKAVNDERIELWGTGQESRDFIHASDVAGAALAIIEQGAFEAESYNVASGQQTTIAELATLLAAEFGLPDDAVVFTGERRPGDPVNWQANTSRIARLGFSPRVALEVGATAYARWASRELRQPRAAGAVLPAL